MVGVAIYGVGPGQGVLDRIRRLSRASGDAAHVCPSSRRCPGGGARTEGVARSAYFSLAGGDRCSRLVTADHLKELTDLVLEHMVRLCQHVGDEEVQRAKMQVRERSRFTPANLPRCEASCSRERDRRDMAGGGRFRPGLSFGWG